MEDEGENIVKCSLQGIAIEFMRSYQLWLPKQDLNHIKSIRSVIFHQEVLTQLSRLQKRKGEIMKVGEGVCLGVFGGI